MARQPLIGGTVRNNTQVSVTRGNFSPPRKLVFWGVTYCSHIELMRTAPGSIDLELEHDIRDNLRVKRGRNMVLTAVRTQMLNMQSCIRCPWNKTKNRDTVMHGAFARSSVI